MKKIIGIYCGNIGNYEDTESRSLGGSETWTLSISEQFVKFGYHVIVFCNTSYWHYGSNGVEFVPYNFFSERCTYQRFDYFISNRICSEITPELCCDNIYVMVHDICIHEADSLKDLKLDRVRKFAYLSDYHKWCLNEWYKGAIPEDRYMRTFNGIDPELYVDYGSVRKENYMVWSSRKERGLSYLVNWVLPIIREQIPDFTVKICLYSNDINDDGFYENHIAGREGVEVVGSADKKTLSELQKGAKVWIYPNLGFYDTNGTPFQETFCITAVENAMAGNAIITCRNGGLESTLQWYEGFIGDSLIKNKAISGLDDMKEYAKNLANSAVLALTNEGFRNDLAASAKDICRGYTWEKSAMTWINEWYETNGI